MKRVIGGHWGLVPKLQHLAVTNQIEAYNLPQGVITHLFRDIAAHRPGHITRVGLGTFVDPRNGGGKLNARTKEDIVRLIDIDGEECLLYKTFPINVGIIRATTGDPDGNLTMEKEALTLEALRHRHGGAQLRRHRHRAGRARRRERLAQSAAGEGAGRHGRLRGGREAREPLADLRDAVQSGLFGEIRARAGSLPPMRDGARKIIARRAALELTPNSVVNLGIGMPEGVAAIANEEKIADLITLTAEPGVIGGIPASGLISARRSTRRR